MLCFYALFLVEFPDHKPATQRAQSDICEKGACPSTPAGDHVGLLASFRMGAHVMLYAHRISWCEVCDHAEYSTLVGSSIFGGASVN